MANTKEEAIRDRTRKVLKHLERDGTISDWDFVPLENTYFITLLTGDEIELNAQEVVAFKLGVVSCRIYGVVSRTGKYTGDAMNIALRGAKVPLDK